MCYMLHCVNIEKFDMVSNSASFDVRKLADFYPLCLSFIGPFMLSLKGVASFNKNKITFICCCASQHKKWKTNNIICLSGQSTNWIDQLEFTIASFAWQATAYRHGHYKQPWRHGYQGNWDSWNRMVWNFVVQLWLAQSDHSVNLYIICRITILSCIKIFFPETILMDAKKTEYAPCCPVKKRKQSTLICPSIRD